MSDKQADTYLREGECSGCGEKMVRPWNRTSAAYPHDCETANE